MTATVTPTASIAVFPIEEQYRKLDADCSTCGGQYVDVTTGDPCPDCAGDETVPVMLALGGLEGQVQMHAAQLGRRIAEVEREAKVLEDHAEAVKLRAESRRKRALALKQWLQLQMEAAGLEKFKDAYVTVWTQRSNPSMEIVDEEAVPRVHKRATLKMPLELVPAELTDCIVGIDVPKEPLHKHLEETGEIPPGVEYIADRRHLRVRAV